MLLILSITKLKTKKQPYMASSYSLLADINDESASPYINVNYIELKTILKSLLCIGSPLVLESLPLEIIVLPYMM